MLRARRARRQRRADADAGVGMAGAQLVGQERTFASVQTPTIPRRAPGTSRGCVQAAAPNRNGGTRSRRRRRPWPPACSVAGNDGNAKAAPSVPRRQWGPKWAKCWRWEDRQGRASRGCAPPAGGRRAGRAPRPKSGDRALRGIAAHQPARLVVADVQEVRQGRDGASGLTKSFSRHCVINTPSPAESRAGHVSPTPR